MITIKQKIFLPSGCSLSSVMRATIRPHFFGLVLMTIWRMWTRSIPITFRRQILWIISPKSGLLNKASISFYFSVEMADLYHSLPGSKICIMSCPWVVLQLRGSCLFIIRTKLMVSFTCTVLLKFAPPMYIGEALEWSILHIRLYKIYINRAWFRSVC